MLIQTLFLYKNSCKSSIIWINVCEIIVTKYVIKKCKINHIHCLITKQELNINQYNCHMTHAAKSWYSTLSFEWGVISRFVRFWIFTYPLQESHPWYDGNTYSKSRENVSNCISLRMLYNTLYETVCLKIITQDKCRNV